MKKLMIAGLVAAVACTSQAGLLTKAGAALQGKVAGVQVVSTATTTINPDDVSILSLSDKELDQTMTKLTAKASRKSFIVRLRKEVMNWKPVKLLKPVRAAALAVLDGLVDADNWIAQHWKEKILPTIKKVVRDVREFFGGIGK